MQLLFNDLTPYFVVGIIIVLFFAIYKEWTNPSFAFFSAIIVFMFCGFITGEEIIRGLGNTKIISILLLIVISNIIRIKFNLEPIFDFFFNTATTYRGFLIRMTTQSAFFSSFINNAPIVALVTSYTLKFANKNNIAPSKLLIPLSFATILGGMITTIGTSTTLLIIGFLEDKGLPSIYAFDLFFIGGITTIVGISFLVIVSPLLLKERSALQSSYKNEKREYLIEFKMSDNCALINKTLEHIKNLSLEDIHLMGIIRDNKQIIGTLSPNDVILKDDKLIFGGSPSSLLKIDKNIKGLLVKEINKNNLDQDLQLVEVVLSGNSDFIGLSPLDAEFTDKFDATVVAIHRNGEHITADIGNTKLAAGDLLLLFAGKNFDEKVDPHRDIILIKKKLNNRKRNTNKKIYALICILFSNLVYYYLQGNTSLLTILLIILLSFVSFRIVSFKEIKRNIDPHLTAILLFSLALGKVIESSSTGVTLANGIVNILPEFTSQNIIIAILILSSLLTNIVGNIGAVSITFPITLGIVEQLNHFQPVNILPFILAITFGSASTFITPFSYQTNLIIYGPGGYTLKDFLKIGIPMTILYLTISFLCIQFLYFK